MKIETGVKMIPPGIGVHQSKSDECDAKPHTQIHNTPGGLLAMEVIFGGVGTQVTCLHFFQKPILVPYSFYCPKTGDDSELWYQCIVSEKYPQRMKKLRSRQSVMIFHNSSKRSVFH